MKKFSLNLTDQQKLFLATLLPKGYSLTETNSAATDLHLTGRKSNVKNKSQIFKEGDESSKSSNSHQSAPQNKSKTSTPIKESKIIHTEEKTIKKSEKISTQNGVLKKDEKLRFFNLLLDQIQKKKSASIFIEPVDPIKLGIPNYFDIIKYPMAIETMRTKVKQGKYIKFCQFEKDLQQISSNCVKFNAGNNYFVQMAKKFQMEFIKILEKYNKKIDSLFNEDEQNNHQSSKNFEQNSEQQTNSQAEITRKDKGNKKFQKLEKIQRKKLDKNEISLKDTKKDNQEQNKVDSKFIKPTDSNNKEKIIKESVCLKIGKAKETQKKLDNQIEGQTNSDQNKNERKEKQEKQKNLLKVKEKKTIRIKKYSYQDRLGIISRIKKLDRATMSQFFQEINFSKGESLDFKVLEDEKIKEMELKLKKYEIIHQEKLRKIQELNKGKSTSQDFEIEEDKDYED